MIQPRPGRQTPILRLAVLAVVLLLSLAGQTLAADPGTNPFTSAVTRFIIDSGTIESVQSREGLPGDYQPSTVFYHFCSPPGDSETNTVASGSLDVAPDGKLTGTCQASRTTTATDGTQFVTAKAGTLSGQYDLAAQTVTFHFEGTTEETYIPPPSCTDVSCVPVTTVYGIVVDGPVSGGEVVGDTAEGIARHTYTCAPANTCFVTRQVATAKFLIQFLPALPSQAPAAGGGGTDGGEGIDGLILLMIIILMLLLLAGALAFLRARGGRIPVPSSGGAAPGKPARPSTPMAEGWAGTFADSSDALAEDWVLNTGVVGTPGSVRPPPPTAGPTADQETLDTLVQFEQFTANAERQRQVAAEAAAEAARRSTPVDPVPPAPMPGGGEFGPEGPMDPGEARFIEDVERLRGAREASAKKVEEVVDMGADLLGDDPGKG